MKMVVEYISIKPYIGLCGQQFVIYDIYQL
jgi:hypothetical protein